MAEALFNKRFKAAGLENEFIAYSAGTANYHVGEAPDHRTLKVLEENRINFSHLGRQVKTQDFESIDFFFAMDENNFEHLQRLKPKNFEGSIQLLRKYDPFSLGSNEVPDPYYGSYQDFQTVFQILNHCFDTILEDYLAGKGFA
ncbi:low molecular weight protein-tyrosine-phosphatase, partial [Umezakia ovalisporum]|uniref:low molecular weight protein-tyrosine-phosphatase n=1 Tax=Umezakia ovalisporum TaxID=75695 RepID=UPI0039C6BC72